MTMPVRLIAQREFRTYVATVTFWIALAVGPLAAGGVLLVLHSHAAARPVQIQAGNAALVRSASAALEEAGRLEGRRYALGQGGARLTLRQTGAHAMVARFSKGFPLSRTGRLLVLRTLERDAARRAAANSPPLMIRESDQPGRMVKPNAGGIARFSLMMLLWLTLTGSLGMLLQSVVRERANRALESLMAAARPWEIMVGKLAGVGAISLAVLATWLGAMAAFAAAPQAGIPAMPNIVVDLAAPLELVRAGIIYVLAYAFYGSVTIGLGAMARDSAAAQNLARPLFVVLLVVFFVALISTASGETAALTWLVYLPPFAPFMLLLQSPGALTPAAQLLSLGLLAAAAAIAGWLAVGRLSLEGGRRGGLSDMLAAWRGGDRHPALPAK